MYPLTFELEEPSRFSTSSRKIRSLVVESDEESESSDEEGGHGRGGTEDGGMSRPNADEIVHEEEESGCGRDDARIPGYDSELEYTDGEADGDPNEGENGGVVHNNEATGLDRRLLRKATQ